LSEFIFFVTQQPLEGLGLLIVDVSRSHSRNTTFGRILLEEWSANLRDV